jgi:hypothetical protein
MSARLRRILYLSAALVCLPGLAEAQADGLKHDPFARPVLAPRPAPRPASAASVPGNSVKAPVPEPVWKPELRAVLVAGPKSIVNVGGALVRIGEQINGYRLVEVHEETAVFVNDKKTVTLSLRSTVPLRNPPPRQDERELKERRDLPPRQDDRGTNERRDAPPSQDDRGVAQPRDDASKPEDK